MGLNQILLNGHERKKERINERKCEIEVLELQLKRLKEINLYAETNLATERELIKSLQGSE